MLKAGIFLDMENLMRNGGWGLRYDVIKDLVVAQGTEVLRANAYMAMDEARARDDFVYRQQKEGYHAAIRRNGFHLVLKKVKRYRDAEGVEFVKADADLDLAVDALLQSENLDYVLLGTGDGDFLRLVRALQSHGKRVDLLSFGNTSTELRKEVDNHFLGFLIPGVVQRNGDDRHLGYLHSVNEERGFGFMTLRTGLRIPDVRDDIFCHITEVRADGHPIDNIKFSSMRSREQILEFTLVQDDNGRPQAVDVIEYNWDKR